MIPLLAAAALIFGSMLIEALLSRAHEQKLRARGAVEPPGDAWRAMSIVYPAAFGAMLLESALRGGPPESVFAAGLTLWILAKLLKGWAIASLGERWSFRVLVLPGASLIAGGPYRWMRHPNYVAVIGEFAGAAIMLIAPVAFAISIVLFGRILLHRIRVEEHALGLRRI